MSVAVAQTKSDQSGVYEREDLLNGCQAVAHGVRLADVDVIAAYPIRPYTEVMDALSKLIADGQFDAEYIIADSERAMIAAPDLTACGFTDNAALAAHLDAFLQILMTEKE